MKLPILFLFLNAVHAAPVGNTSAPMLIQQGVIFSHNQSVSLRVGYEGDFVADGRLKQFDQGTGRVDTFQQDTNAGTITLNILNRMDIYTVLGASDFKANWRFSDANTGTINRIKVNTEVDFLWGLGARAILFEWCKTSLGFGGRYSESKYTPTKFTSDGTIQQIGIAECLWRQWQVNLDFSYKITYLIPYIGIKYSNEKTVLRNFSAPISADLTGDNSFETRIPVGLYVGCALSNGKYFMLNLEGRLVDEEAVSVSCDFQF